MKSRTAALAVPGGFFVASVAARILLARAPAHVVANDLAQPIAVVTNWGGYGALLFGTLFASLAIATAGYMRTLGTMCATGDAAPLRWTIGVAIVSLAVGWTVPALFSSDVYAYAAYGELARLGANPYAHAPLPANDPLFAAAVWQWGNPLPVCVYGPLFVAIAAGIVIALHGAGVTAQLDGLRAAASLSWIACAPLAFAAYRGAVANRLAAAATIVLNPVALWSAIEGHNDAIALAAVLAGFAVMRSGRLALGGAVAGLAGAVKLPALAGAVASAIADRRARLGAAFGAAAALALSIALIAAALRELAPHGRYAPEASFEAFVKPLALAAIHDDAAATWLTWAMALAAALACARAGASHLRKARKEGWIYAGLAAWLLVPNPYPWYAVWLLPLAALAPSSRAARVAIWLSLASLLRYVPDAVGAPSPLGAVLLGVAATLPFLGLFGLRNLR